MSKEYKRKVLLLSKLKHKTVVLAINSAEDIMHRECREFSSLGARLAFPKLQQLKSADLSTWVLFCFVFQQRCNLAVGVLDGHAFGKVTNRRENPQNVKELNELKLSMLPHPPLSCFHSRMFLPCLLYQHCFFLAPSVSVLSSCSLAVQMWVPSLSPCQDDASSLVTVSRVNRMFSFNQ